MCLVLFSGLLGLCSCGELLILIVLILVDDLVCLCGLVVWFCCFALFGVYVYCFRRLSCAGLSLLILYVVCA